MGYAKVLRRQNIPNAKQLDGTKTGNGAGNEKMKNGNNALLEP